MGEDTWRGEYFRSLLQPILFAFWAISCYILHYNVQGQTIDIDILKDEHMA